MRHWLHFALMTHKKAVFFSSEQICKTIAIENRKSILHSTCMPCDLTDFLGVLLLLMKNKAPHTAGHNAIPCFIFCSILPFPPSWNKMVGEWYENAVIIVEEKIKLLLPRMNRVFLIRSIPFTGITSLFLKAAIPQHAAATNVTRILMSRCENYRAFYNIIWFWYLLCSSNIFSPAVYCNIQYRRNFKSFPIIGGQRGGPLIMTHHHFPKLHCSNDDVIK